MKSTGIVRGVDGLGRIVLPKELRTSMKLDNDAKLEIFAEIMENTTETGWLGFNRLFDSNIKMTKLD